jgi:hypothetical protein
LTPDSKAKLRGLAAFAEKFGDQFVRIESIVKTASGVLRFLDLLDPKVRQEVRDFQGGKVTVLYESQIASDYH